jgi:hypothetical protein
MKTKSNDHEEDEEEVTHKDVPKRNAKTKSNDDEEDEEEEGDNEQDLGNYNNSSKIF